MTTLVYAIGRDDQQITLASLSGVVNPGSLSAFNAVNTAILIDNEYMAVNNNYKPGSKIIPVVRGTNGTFAWPHAAGAAATVIYSDATRT